MKTIGLFSFDGPMYKDVNGVYCNGYITDEMLQRYLNVVDELRIIIRCFQLSKTFEEEKLKPILSKNVTIIEMPNFNSPKGMVIDQFTWQKKLDAIVSESDLIFCRIPSMLSDMVARLAKKQGKKYLVEVGGCAWDAYSNHSLIGKLVAPSMYLNQKKTVASAAYASYVTSRWLQKRYPNNGEQIVASNVHIKETPLSILEEKCRRYEQLKGNEVIRIGTIANVDVRYKGQEYIVKALKQLTEQGYNIHYDLVGGGDPTFLTQLAEKAGVLDRVHFKGRMLHEEVLEWLDNIDIYAQPSKQEGLPRSVIEAMSRGCIAIGSTTAGIPELLQDQLIFKNGDVNGIVNIIKYIVENDYIVNQSIAKENFEKATSFHFDRLENIRTRFFKSYQEDVLGTE